MSAAPTLMLPTDLCRDCETFLTSRAITKLTDIPLADLVEEFGDAFTDCLNTEPDISDLAGHAPPNAIVAIDLPNPPKDTSFAIVRATAIFHLVNTAVFTPQLDSGNALPFTVYKSSASNVTKMKEAGIRFYSPDEKLGYHNDVFHCNGEYRLPQLVSLINLFIGYHQPGCFHFVDKREWPDLSRFLTRGIGKSFLFRPTPVVYESKLENAKGLDDYKPVLGMWKDSDDEGYVFCNGELIGSDEEGTVLLNEVKESLLTAKHKISTPQTTDRIFLFRNDLGFHSRDIFEGQFVHQGVTRLFLRAVSATAVEVPRCPESVA